MNCALTNMCLLHFRYLLVLECRQLHLAKRFSPKGPSSVAKSYKPNLICFIPFWNWGPKRFAKWSYLPRVLHLRTNKCLYIEVVMNLYSIITSLLLKHTWHAITGEWGSLFHCSSDSELLFPWCSLSLLPKSSGILVIMCWGEVEILLCPQFWFPLCHTGIKVHNT